jgi:hydrogenase maturation protease
MSDAAPLLVLGLGNVLCGDDGLGVVAVDRLARRFAAPSGAQVLDGGTLGLSLLPHVEDAGALILVDATLADAPPGALVRLTGDEVGAAVRERLSPHQIGVADLLQGARLLQRCPRALVLLGLVPQTLDLGLGLSVAVQAAVPRLVERIVVEAHLLGYEFTPRPHDELPSSTAPGAARALGL